MSGRLDQSLDSIIDSQKKAKKEAHRRRKPAVRVKAPVGGVKKTTKPAKPAVKPAAAASQPISSKIVVSGLPYDVNEAQIKEYFSKSVGSVKKVSLQYNQGGQSRGIADIIFGKPGLAAKAAKELNGMLVDRRPMKIEVIVDANSVPEPKSKGLMDRVTYANPICTCKPAPLTQTSANPKAQPKSAVPSKANTKINAKGAKAGKPKKTKTARPKPKTADELDAEMVDYFAGNNNAGATNSAVTATNGAAAPATGGEDLGMDEISVSSFEIIT